MKQTETLREDQELLLLRYLDGESGFFERRKAKRLLGRSDSARAFLEDMQSLGDDTRRVASDQDFERSHGKVDLWDQISIRIEQEERAEAFLGRREVVKEAPSIGWGTVWSAGATGAFASALLMFTLFQSSQGILPSSAPTVTSVGEQNFASLSDNAFAPIAQAVSSQQSVPQLMSRWGEGNYRANTRPLRVTAVASAPQRAVSRARTPLQVKRTVPIEVDWMRSDGSVQLLQPPTSRVPVIWVKKRNYSPSRTNGASRSRRVPTAQLVTK